MRHPFWAAVADACAGDHPVHPGRDCRHLGNHRCESPRCGGNLPPFPRPSPPSPNLRPLHCQTGPRTRLVQIRTEPVRTRLWRGEFVESRHARLPEVQGWQQDRPAIPPGKSLPDRFQLDWSQPGPLQPGPLQPDWRSRCGCVSAWEVGRFQADRRLLQPVLPQRLWLPQFSILLTANHSIEIGDLVRVSQGQVRPPHRGRSNCPLPRTRRPVRG